MRHEINSTIAVITYESSNPFLTEPTERFAYYIAYHDDANALRQSEEMTGFISHEDVMCDAMRWLDKLDMTPEPKIEREPKITTPYHHHICKQSCGLNRCVNPKCEVAREFTPKRVAEIICPVCGEMTGNQDFFERQRLTVAEYIPLAQSQAIAA
jgi:hypothetical protein